MRKITFLLAVMAVFWGSYANAANWYVSNNSSGGITGVDATTPVGTGQSVGAPFLTIAYAITQAASGDVINIAAGTYTEYSLNPGDKSLTFQGAGIGSTFIQAYASPTGTSGSSTNTAGVFTVTTAATTTKSLSFSGLTIQNGSNTAGGSGILVSSGTNYLVTLTFTNVQFKDNLSNANSIYGGAVYLNAKTNTSFNSCIFTTNKNKYNGGGGAIAIGTSGPTTLNINNCYFNGNLSGNKGGGAIYNLSSTNPVTITIKNSTFSGNQTSVTNGIVKGGALNILAGATSGTNTLWIENSTFYNNKATYAGSVGGAIYFSASAATNNFTINHCSITGNTSNAGNGGDGVCINSAGSGQTNLVMNNSIIIGNSGSTANASQVGTDAADQSKITNGGIKNCILGGAATSGTSGIVGTWIDANTTHNTLTAGTNDLAFGTITTDATPVLPIGAASIARNYVATNYLSPALNADQISQSRMYKPDAGAYESQSAVYQVTLTAGSNGSVSAPTGGYGDGYYDSGANATITATAVAGNAFSKWTNTSTGADVSASNPYTFNVTAATGLTANFVASANPSTSVSTTTLTGFKCGPTNGPSTEQSFTVSGLNLTNNITVTPPTDYEISSGTGGSFVATNPITISKNYTSSGTVTNYPIYVRLKNGLTASTTYNENIAVASIEASPDLNVACSGYTLAAQPTTAVSTITASVVAPTSLNLAWSGSDGAKHVVVYSTNNDVNSVNLPVGGTTYAAGNIIASGYVVGYAGSASSATITGLTANTTYYFAVFPYNDGGSAGYENYLTSSAITLTQATSVSSVATDYFQSRASGNWATGTTWNSSTVDASYHVADLAPGSAAASVIITSAGSPVTISTDIVRTGFTMQDGSTVAWNYAATFTKTIAATGTIGITASTTQDYSPVITGASTINISLGVSSRQSAEWSYASFPASSQVNFSTSLGSADLGIEPTTLSNVKVDLGALVKLLKATNEDSGGSTVISIGALSGASTSVINSGQQNGRTMAYNIGASNTDATFAGQINNQDVSRVLNINKVGSGNWTLTNANAGFTNGSFNVNAGTVTLNSGAGLGTVPVTVASGATLKGAGSIAGATTVNGTLAGKLSFGSTLALAGTTNLSVSGFNTGEYDVITTAGGTNGGTLNITITASTPAANTRITLISSSPARTGSFASVNIKDGSGNPLSGYSFNSATGELGYLVPPTTQPTNASASNTLATTTSLSWTAGDGAKYLALYSTNSDVATAHLPVEHTAYTVGSQIAEGYYVGSVSGGTTASITGLTPNTLYYFAVFSYNDYNGTGIENYVTASPATTSVTTLQASFDTDYFKTTASGNWSAISTWVSSTDNSSWHVASLVPNAASTASKVLVTAAASPLTITSDIGISGFDMENGSNVIWNHAAELTKAIAATGTIGITASATQDYSPVITGASTINITLGVSSRQSAEWSRASFPASSQVNFSTSLGSADLGIEPTTLSNVKVDLGANVKLLKGTNEASDGSTVISIGALSGASTSVINSGQQNGRTMAYNIGALNTDATFAGQIYNQNIARVLNVNKVGTGTWTLTNANTGFTNGSLNINDGTVILGTGAGIGSATASVSGNGTLVIPADAIFPNAITVNVNDNGAGHLNIPNGSTIASFSIGLASAPTPGSSFSVFGTTDPATITYTATTIAPGFSYNATTGVVTYNGSTVSSSDTTFISVLSTPSNATLHVDNATAILKIDQNATFRDLTVAAGAKLSVATGKTLNVSTLNLQSTASGTATYVNKGRATITTANVQQWLTTGRNWYISSPLRHTLTSSLTSATSVQYWDEPSGTWKNAADTLISGKGYISVATSSTGNILFNGTLNDDTVIVHLTRTKDAYKEGFNLVGNPYPSYLSWDAVEKTNVDPTVWYRTKNSAGSYKFGTYNTTSQLGTNVGANDTDQKDIVTGNIPPLQAFWVRVLPAGDGSSTTGTLLFKNTMRSHKSAQLQGDAQTYNDGLLRVRSVVNSAQQVVRLQVSNGTNSDEAIVLFNANAQNGLDDYDSYKMSNGSAAIPEIFTTVGTSNLAINGLNSLETANVLPLGFATGQANTFTIKASQVSNLEGYSIFLLDNKLGTEAELTNGEAYTFTSDITNTTSRFSVVLKANGVTTGTELRKAESGLAAYCNAKKQIVVSGVSADDNIGVYNSLGQKVMEKRYTSQPMTLQGNFTPGVYLVVVNNAIQKVLVK